MFASCLKNLISIKLLGTIDPFEPTGMGFIPVSNLSKENQYRHHGRKILHNYQNLNQTPSAFSQASLPDISTLYEPFELVFPHFHSTLLITSHQICDKILYIQVEKHDVCYRFNKKMLYPPSATSVFRSLTEFAPSCQRCNLPALSGREIGCPVVAFVPNLCRSFLSLQLDVSYNG